jgi:hypothetical protein
MYWKLILICFSVYSFSCGQSHTNLQYFENLRYKPLFTYTHSDTAYTHVLFVEKYKSGKKLGQEELEALALNYAAHNRNIICVQYINNEFAQNDYVDEYRIASVYFFFENNERKIKQFYRYDK